MLKRRLLIPKTSIESPQMITLRILLILLVYVMAGTMTPVFSKTLLIQVVDKDLSEKGNGEGLAKALPGQPILIHHPLDMGMAIGTDNGVALAVGMQVGKTKKTLKALQEILPLDLKTALQQIVQNSMNSSTGKKLEKELNQKKHRLLLKPYVVLSGTPKGFLESRLVILEQTDQGQTVKEQMVSLKSEKFPIEGEKSWSQNEGRLLHDTALQALPKLWEQAVSAYLSPIEE